MKYVFYLLFFATTIGVVFGLYPKIEERVKEIVPKPVNLEPKAKTSVLLFTGDIMLSRGVGAKMAKYDDYTFPFLKISDFLSSADLTVGNLEGPISDKGEEVGNVYSFRDDPKAMVGLKLAGFDILDINNNHIMDWGKEALKDTMTRLKDNGINYSGAGIDYAEANSPIIKDIDGTKIAFMSFSDLSLKYAQAVGNQPGISDLNIDKIKEQIKNIKDTGQANLVVVMFHWGEEYQTQSSSRQQSIAHQLIDNGADLIVGHHPHVPQEVEKYGSGWAAYSLGNLVFDQYFSKETMGGLVLRVFISDKKISQIEPIKTEMSTEYQPFIPTT
jgi:poly-gamma-glutamate synthesis protein (capsule biosynthesis protein)